MITGIFTGFLMALFGIGGGAFVVPALDASFNVIPNQTHPPFQIIVIGSLTAIFIGSLPRAIKHLKTTSLERKIAFALLFGALPLITICGFITPLINENFLRTGFGLLIGAVGIWMYKSNNQPHEINNGRPKVNWIKILVIGGIAGISSTFFGLGGATLLTPLLAVWAALPMMICINISIIFVAITSLFSLATLSYSWIKFHGTSEFNYPVFSLILLMGLAAAISQNLFSRKIVRMDDALRKKLLGTYLVILSAWMTYRALIASL